MVEVGVHRDDGLELRDACALEAGADAGRVGRDFSQADIEQTRPTEEAVGEEGRGAVVDQQRRDPEERHRQLAVHAAATSTRSRYCPRSGRPSLRRMSVIVAHGGTMGRVTGSSSRHHADRCPGVAAPVDRRRRRDRPAAADRRRAVRAGAGSTRARSPATTPTATCTSPSAPTSSCAASTTTTAACRRSWSTRSTAAGLLPSPTPRARPQHHGVAAERTHRRPGRPATGGPELDGCCAPTPAWPRLAGRFLFVLDDGRGDLVGRSLDLGLMAVDAGAAQLRVGSHHWGHVVALDEAPDVLLDAGPPLRRRAAGTATTRRGTSTSCRTAVPTCSA